MASPYDPEDHKDKSGHTSPEFLHELEKKHKNNPDTDKASKQESEEVDNASRGESENSNNFTYGSSESKTEHEEQVGRGYVPHKPHGQYSNSSVRRWLFGKRKAALGGGVVGTLVGLFFFFSFTSGPLEFIHLAQLMERFHFSTNQDLSDDRFTKLARYIHHRSTGEVEKTRLGVLQNKIADKIEARMAKSGIETSYTDTFRFRDGYVIDPTKLEGTNLKDLDGKNPREVRNYFQERFPGLDIDIQDGKVFINAENLGYFRNSALTKTMLRASGYSKKASVIGARTMTKRYGISLHPMAKIDRKILTTSEARYKKWRENRARTISEGGAPNLNPRSIPTDDPDDSDAANRERAGNANDVAADAEGTISDANEASDGVNNGDTDSISKFQNKLSVKLTAGGAGAAGILCLAQGIGKSAGDIKHAQVVAPLIRIGMDGIANGNQVMAGQEVDLEQLGFLKKQLAGKDGSGEKSSWNQARSIKAMLGQSGGVEADDTLKTINKGTPFDFLSEGEAGAALNPVCTVVNSPLGIAVGFLGGPLSGIANLVGGEVLGRTLIPQIARWLAGKAVDPFVAGADFGNYVNYGSFLAANAQAVTNGGRGLEADESRQLAEFQSAESQREFKSRGVAYRLFNPYDYRSAISQAIDNRSSLDLASSAFNPLNLFSSLSQVFSKEASAQTGSYNYGIKKIGFSKDEINNRAAENPYKNAEEVVNTILPARGQAFIDKAEKCFGIEMDPVTYDINSYQAGDPKYNELDSDDCTDKSNEWMKVRFYILDTHTMDSIACYEGEEQSCADIGFGSPEASSDTGGTQDPATKIDMANLFKESRNIACASGTNDLGVQDGYYEGKKIDIRVCGLQTVPETGTVSSVPGANSKCIVNSRLSAFYAKLVEDAKSAGVKGITAQECFRTMQRQVDLQPTGRAAPPGYSNHQMGLAIDWSSSMISWLNTNGTKYGLSAKVDGEPWHWSPTGG